MPTKTTHFPRPTKTPIPGYEIHACNGRAGPRFSTSTNPAEVTCKRCLAQAQAGGEELPKAGG